MIQVWYPVQSYHLEIISSSTCLTVHADTSFDRGRQATCYSTCEQINELLLTPWGLLECMCERGFLCWQSTQRGSMCEKKTRVSSGILHLVLISFILKWLSGCVLVCMYTVKGSAWFFIHKPVFTGVTPNTLQTQHIQETQVTQGEDGTSCSLLFHCLISQRLFNMQLTEHKEGSLPPHQLYFIILQSLQECTLR